MADTEQVATTEEQTATKEEVKATEEAAPAPAENGEAKEEEKKEEETAKEGEEGKTEEKGEEGEKGEGEGEKEDANGDAKQAEPAQEVCLDAPTENPLTDDDYQELIKLDAAESDEGWEKIKKHKDVIVFRKTEKNGAPVIKVSPIPSITPILLIAGLNVHDL